MIPIVIDPIEEGMTIVLSRDAAQKHKTTKHRVGTVLRIHKPAMDEEEETETTFSVEMLTPNKRACSCVTKKKHRVNQTTSEHVCTDPDGEFRHGFSRAAKPKTIVLSRSDFWKIQEFS